MNVSHAQDSSAVEPREKLVLGSYPGTIPQVGEWLWAMEDARAKTIHALDRIERTGFGQEFLDWRGPDGKDNSVGALLYHIAIVEIDWLYFDMLLAEPPAEIAAVFPFEHRDESGTLVQGAGQTMAEHKERLAFTRQHFMGIVSKLDLEDWQRLREPANVDYKATPGWIVYHLVEHEYGHLYEIRRIVRKWLEAKGQR